MKLQRLFILVFFVMPLVVMAQVKIATVDVQALLDAMPESKAANEQLAKLSEQYKAEYEMMQSEFNSKFAAYQAIANDKDTPVTIRDRRVREIQDGDREIGLFLEKTKTLLQDKKQELEAPLYEKINAAIKQVGDAGGYTYIIDVSRSPVAYSGVGSVDLTDTVKQLLLRQ